MKKKTCGENRTNWIKCRVKFDTDRLISTTEKLVPFQCRCRWIFFFDSLAYFHSISLSLFVFAACVFIYLFVYVILFWYSRLLQVSELLIFVRILHEKKWNVTWYKYSTCVWIGLVILFFSFSYFRWCVFIRTNWRRLCFVDGDIFFRSDIFSRNGSFAPEKKTLTHTHNNNKLAAIAAAAAPPPQFNPHVTIAIMCVELS